MKEKLKEFNENASKQKEILEEIENSSKILEGTKDPEEKKMISLQIENLKKHLKKTNNENSEKLKEIGLAKPIFNEETNAPHFNAPPESTDKKFSSADQNVKIDGITKFERDTIKRLKKKKNIPLSAKTKKPNSYVAFANKIFSERSFSLSKKNIFRELERDLVKSNLQFILPSYISVILLTTVLSVIFAFFLFLFFLFFNIISTIPIITPVESAIASRAIKIFWILLVIPITTLLVMYFYPSLEKKSIESRIDQELPFATINMAAISNSMIEPVKIFSILISTKEYPYLGREFTKIMNEINVYGYNLVNALREVAFNSPSKKLSELLNGLSTTINSGGSLPQFFDRRSQSLMFEYRLKQEESTKYAETFMDIYISVVVAAPMILMLLLVMMKISNLGISFSTSTISLIMVLGVSVINILFLTFLHLKQPNR